MARSNLYTVVLNVSQPYLGTVQRRRWRNLAYIVTGRSKADAVAWAMEIALGDDRDTRSVVSVTPVDYNETQHFSTI